jgi:ribonuclease HI
VSLSFIVVTDGSGVEGGCGAAAWVVLAPSMEPFLGASTSSYTTVRRMEFSALLDAMWAIGYRFDLLTGVVPPKKAEILWISDRMDLVESITVAATRSLNKRATKDLDLWRRYDELAKYFSVTATHTPRDTVSLQHACDKLAGLCREALQARTDNFNIQAYLDNDSKRRKRRNAADAD